MRTVKDDRAYGTGRSVRDYVKLEFTKDATTNNIKAHVYLIYDQLVVFNNNEIVSVEN